MANNNHSQHVKHLKDVLARLQAHGTSLNFETYQLGVSEVEYLGHHISASGIWLLRDKVAPVRRFEGLATAKGLQTYPGMVNFYLRFLKDAALVLKLLRDVLGGQLDWGPPLLRMARPP